MDLSKIMPDEWLKNFEVEILKNNHWVAYNTACRQLESGDVYFFKEKDDAIDFVKSNISDVDAFKVINVQSVQDLFDQLTKSEHPVLRTEENLVSANENNVTRQFLNKLKTEIMNTQNFNYLKDNLKYMGFGEKLYPELEKNLQESSPEFSIKMQQEYGKDKMNAELFFKRSDQSDMYFFNRYEAKIEADGNTQAQAFYLNKGTGITLKEAYNLLNGRAVNKDLVSKEGQVYNTWLQLDFKETDTRGNFKVQNFHQNYGYDIEKVLSQQPIKELAAEPDRTRLLDSLNRGNRQSATFIENGKEEKFFIEANPKFKSINIYDGNMQRVINNQKHGEGKSQGEVNGHQQDVKKQSQKTNDTEDSPDVPDASKKRSRKKSQRL